MRSLLFCLMLSIALPGAAQQKKRIAVLDFEYGTVQSNAAAIFGTNVDVGRGIRDLMVERFVTHGIYSVVERAALDKILAEQNFSNSDRANVATAAQLGKVLGVDAIVIGSITQFGRDDESRSVGGGAFGGIGRKYGLGGVKQSSAKAVVGITARIIDTETAEILAVSNGSGESKRSGASLYGAGGLSGAGGLGGVDMTSSNFGATLIGEAVYEAVDPVVAELERYADRLAHRPREVSGLVADYSDGFVILNIGSNGGAGVGDRFESKRVVREGKDPATGPVLRRIEESRGVAVITEVDEVSAVGRFSGAGVPRWATRLRSWSERGSGSVSGGGSAMRRICVGLFVAGFVLPLLPAANRVALVIGNGRYQHVAPLQNPANDAHDRPRSWSGWALTSPACSTPTCGRWKAPGRASSAS